MCFLYLIPATHFFNININSAGRFPGMLIFGNQILIIKHEPFRHLFLVAIAGNV